MTETVPNPAGASWLLRPAGVMVIPARKGDPYMKRTTRLAALPAATLLFGGLFTLNAPMANACYAGTPFVAVAAGAADGGDYYWTTTTTGPTTISITPIASTGHIHVFDQNCAEICSIEQSCAVTAGTYTVLVHGSGAYTLTAVPDDVTVPGIDPLPPGDCNLVNTAGVCANVETHGEVERAYVYGVQQGTAATHTVVGRVDRYRFPLPTGGSTLLPCVVLTVNNTGNDDCAVAGGTYDSTVATLVSRSVDQPSVGLGAPLASVGICESAVTITVAGFGVEDFPAYSLC